MDAVIVAAALILAAVFGTAGVAKLTDLGGTRTAIREFGAPRRSVALLSLGLPAAEIAVAILLLAASTRAMGAAGALALLSVFSIAIAVSLARGRTPDCHCFGQLHSAPAGPRTLARNGLLAVLAGIALAPGLGGESPSAVSWATGLGGLAILAIALAGAVVALGTVGMMAFLSLLRSYGSILVRLDIVERRLAAAGLAGDDAEVGQAPELGLAPGSPAPGFVANDVSGTAVSLDDLLAPGLPLLLLFSSPACGPCTDLLPDVAAWQDEHADTLTIAIASGGDDGAAAVREDGLERMLVDSDLAIYDAYRAAGTPSAVLIGPDGVIASHVAPGSEWIEQLLLGVVREVEGGDEGDGSLPVGSPLPDLTLVGLDAQPVSLVGQSGEPTLVVFWNPDCGFCSSMHDELLTWERSAAVDGSRLVVVSSGDEASTRAEGFTSAVVLDEEFDVGAALGANGTPMAVLIDGEGLVASPLVAGADAILALADSRLLASAPHLDRSKEGATS